MIKTVALIGNPNSGKTLLFNLLTGSNQKVSNFPGVTVEKKIGSIKENGMNITDLPGIYSLSPYSLEEIIARDYIIEDGPDIILNIVDGTNIERNLYLTLQLLELNKPMVIAINMIDELEDQGSLINYDILAMKLGVNVIPISAKNNLNIDKLIHSLNTCEKPKHMPCYDKKTEICKNSILDFLPDNIDVNKVFIATKLMEQDEKIKSFLNLDSALERQIDDIIDNHVLLLDALNKDTYMAHVRYNLIESIVNETVNKSTKQYLTTITEKIDKVIMNRILALPIFLLAMFVIFQITFGTIGSFLQDKMSWFIDNIVSQNLQYFLELNNAKAWTKGLLIDGVIGGVGGILSYMPQIIILFILLTFLEDTGYMARVAFIMDKIMRRIGLSGKSFIPMLMGFGCTTPAVIAARSMDNEMDKRMTIMLTPFMSCSARLPIYVLFAGVFFKHNQGLIVFSMYMIGIVVAILSGLVLKKTLFRRVFSPFIIEIPKYRLPSLKSIFKEAWDKAKGFLIKAGTIIFAMSVVLWILQNFSPAFKMVDNSSESIIGYLGKFIAPIFAPLGFGNWQSAVSILSGVVAKEVVVSSINILFVQSGTLESALAAYFTVASAFSFMVFTLLYMPCLSAFVTIKRELGGWKWAFGTIVLQTVIAYITALVCFNIINFFTR